MGLDDLGGDQVLGTKQLQHGGPVLRAHLLRAGPVAQAEVIQLPLHHQIVIETAAEVGHRAVDAAAEEADAQSARGH